MNAKTIVTTTTQTTHEFDSVSAAIEYLQGIVPATEPVEIAQPTITTEHRDAYEQALDMLKDPRFTLRTVESIEDKTGAEIGYFITWLRDRGIGCVTKRQRHTDKPLIGLAARN